MPLPKILRQFSSKSLKSKDRPSSSGGGSEKETLSSPKERYFPTRQASMPPNRTPLLDSDASKPDGKVRSMTEPLNLAGSLPTPMSTPSIAEVPAGFSPELVEAWNATQKEINDGAEGFSKKIEEKLQANSGPQKVATTVADPIEAVAECDDVRDAIEKGVDGFLETMPILMKALDEVSKVHPFIAVAVLAFKAVYTLEVTRHENDKKIIALYVEMKEMMTVLIQLKDIKDIEQVWPDGQSIKGRLQTLCTQTADDIKKCANTCDTYSKKKLVVKIFAGPIWEERLVAFVGIFAQRKQEFEFSFNFNAFIRAVVHTIHPRLALTIRTSIGVDEANLKLNDMDTRTRGIEHKMELMLQLFRQKFVTPEQKDVSVYIKNKGIESTFKDDNVVKELLAYEAKISSSQDTDTHRVSKNEDISASELHREISENPDTAIKTNAELFDRKFEIQRRHIEADVARAVRREGDRIISAVTSGSHDRIIDSDVYTFWKEMLSTQGWKGSIKSRHFIAALRDYYQEKAYNEDGQGLPAVDKWTLDFINPSYAREIQEAFDDDASGFITVQEVNRMTQLRPRDWSLPHWIAYWAVGWQAGATDYCEKIETIFTKMFHLLEQVKPMNRRIVDQYLVKAWNLVMGITISIQKQRVTDALKTRFEPWITAEEERLKKNLEEIRYDIDAYDTVRLVTGPGRIEMYIFPLIYLLLNRHLEIISIARTHVISKDELWDAHDTLLYIADAAAARLKHVRNVFEQNRLDVKLQFKTFARGLFAQMDETKFEFSGDDLKKVPDPAVLSDESTLPSLDLDPKQILNYPLRPDNAIDYASFDLVEPQVQETGPDSILGPWACLMFNSSSDPLISKLDFTLEKDLEGNGFHAASIQYEAGNENPFKVEGHADAQVDGFADVNFKVSHDTQYTPMEFKGKLDIAEGSMRGTWMYNDGDPGGAFVCKRSQELLRLYYIPHAEETPAKARWRFALDSVLYGVRRDLWSKSFFLERFRDRKRYIVLATRGFHYGKDLTAEEWEELRMFYKSLTTNETRFYCSIINKSLSTSSIHTNIWCDHCGSKLGRARTICMDCGGKSSVDFCGDLACAAATVGLDARDDLKTPHVPTHEVFKVYTVLHGRRHAMTEKKAKNALKRARLLLPGKIPGPSSESTKPAPKETVGKTGESDAAAAPVENTDKLLPACSSCKGKVALSPPCWTCVECADLFICDSCDAKGAAFTKAHSAKHAIVRCQPSVKQISTEERLTTVETRLSTIEGRLSNMENVLHNVLGKLEREDILTAEDVKEVESKM